MRILMVTATFPVLSESGVEQLVYGLADAGHDVLVVSLERGNRVAARPQPASGAGRVSTTCVGIDNRPQRRVATLGRDAARAVKFDVAFARRAAAHCWRASNGGREFLDRLARTLPFGTWDPDVVHFAFATIASDFWDAFRLVEQPSVVSCRGSDVRIHPLVDERLAERLPHILSSATKVHCVSREMAERAEERGLPRGSAVVIPPAIDLRLFRRHPVRDDADGVLRLVTVGRVHWVKGLEDAFRAVRLLVDRGLDVRYTVVGDGDEEPTAAAKLALRDLRLEDRVTLLGPRPRPQMPSLLAAADVFVLPSLSEGISNAALEAMAIGRPVVATAVGGMSEAVRDSVDGFVVKPRDPAALATALEQLVDPGRRHAMGTAAAQRVSADFNLERQVPRFESLYEDAVASRRVTRRHLAPVKAG
jgi:glycosyltransferase involved in cell wall biosynthesis